MSIPERLYYDAQVGVLGSVLLDAPHVAGIVMHRVQPEDFSGAFLTVFQACRKLFMANKPIDSITVSHLVGKEYQQMLLELMELTPTAANVEIYIEQLLEQSKLARIKAEAQRILSCTTLDEASEGLSSANQVLGGRPSVRIVNMEQGLKDFYPRQSDPAQLIPYGIEKIDDTMKTEPGDFIIFGGYPSAGKTAFSLQLAWNQAKQRRVGYFSLETKPEKLIDRMVSAVCDIDFGRVKSHSLNEQDWEQCEGMANTFVGRKLEIIQAGGLSVVDIKALTLAKRYEVIYIDYLQLVRPENRKSQLTDQVTQISIDLHTMAQTTGVTVCALSQLSRPEKSGDQEKAPGLHSLRQSGQIEQDADGVMLLYKEEPDNTKSRRCLKIAKNKDGEAGGVLLFNFDGAHQRFKVSEDPPAIAKRKERKSSQMTWEDLEDKLSAEEAAKAFEK